MNLEQFAAVKGRAVELQKFALELMELGHPKEGIAFAGVALKLLKLRAVKPEQQKLPVDAPKAPEKGKGA